MNERYVVKSGDTLYGISNQFGVSVSDLINVNNVDPKRLQIGQELIIPKVSGTNPSDTFTYVVKKGDTLYGIALKYGTTVSKIKELNRLTTNNLAIGDQLIIPENYNNDVTLPNYKNYVVKKGDTLYGIAKDNNVDINVLIKDNSLTNPNLSIGQVLKIRTNKEDEIEECYGNDYVTTNNYYIVKSGDNLYSIAKKFNTTVDSIKKKNKLSSNLLSIGQKLII
jgi:LysM repeat protein